MITRNHSGIVSSMNDTQQSLTKRLLHVWEPPDFFTLFAAIKRPPHSIKKGTVLFSDGDPLERLYFIKEGFVKLYKISEEGRPTISYLYGPGYVVGLRALFSQDNCAKHNAEALTNIEVISLSHKEYFEIVAKYPAFLIDLTHYFMDRLEYTERTIEGFVVMDTTARISYFFSDFINRFCTPQEKKQKTLTLPLDFTHQRIADFVGALRETVTVTLQRLEKEKVISVNKGKVTILNVPQLNRLAQLPITL